MIFENFVTHHSHTRIDRLVFVVTDRKFPIHTKMTKIEKDKLKLT